LFKICGCIVILAEWKFIYRKMFKNWQSLYGKFGHTWL
jgi:hypothetical protein